MAEKLNINATPNQEAVNGSSLIMPIALAYSGLSDLLLKKYMQDFSYMYEDKVENLPISSIGCVIGTHIGPGGIAVAFFVDKK